MLFTHICRHQINSRQVIATSARTIDISYGHLSGIHNAYLPTRELCECHAWMHGILDVIAETEYLLFVRFYESFCCDSLLFGWRIPRMNRVHSSECIQHRWFEYDWNLKTSGVIAIFEISSIRWISEHSVTICFVNILRGHFSWNRPTQNCSKNVPKYSITCKRSEWTQNNAFVEGKQQTMANPNTENDYY